MKFTERFQQINKQTLMFTLVRMAIGWHFLWEGIIKLSQSQWSAKGYLLASYGPFAPVFHAIAEWERLAPLMASIDFLMPWMLVVSGAGLLLGLYTRQAIFIALALLATFILSMPPIWSVPAEPIQEWETFFGSLNNAPWTGRPISGAEGNYFIINKNIVEFIVLSALLTLNLKQLYGFDALFDREDRKETVVQPALQKQM